jgi:hypothetical protein
MTGAKKTQIIFSFSKKNTEKVSALIIMQTTAPRSKIMVRILKVKEIVCFLISVNQKAQKMAIPQAKDP